MFWLTSSIVHLPKTEVLLDLLLWITKQLLGITSFHFRTRGQWTSVFLATLEKKGSKLLCTLYLIMYPCVKMELGDISCTDALDTFSCFTLLKREDFLFEVGCLDFFRQPNLWSQNLQSVWKSPKNLILIFELSSQKYTWIYTYFAHKVTFCFISNFWKEK